MRISDWSSDVCSSDLVEHVARDRAQVADAVHEDAAGGIEAAHVHRVAGGGVAVLADVERAHAGAVAQRLGERGRALLVEQVAADRSEEHTSELQSLLRISYAVFCLNNKKRTKNTLSETEHE